MPERREVEAGLIEHASGGIRGHCHQSDMSKFRRLLSDRVNTENFQIGMLKQELQHSSAPPMILPRALASYVAPPMILHDWHLWLHVQLPLGERRCHYCGRRVSALAINSLTSSRLYAE
jgi:hypothetical protein